MYNILVVDDDKEIVKAIEIYLKKEGYNIVKAYNGEEALKKIEENEIHLIILDIMMPKKDGIETLEEIRKGKVYSITQIYENVWKEKGYGAENIIAVHIRHIREKIEINPKEPRYLKVIWGVGYKVECL